MISLILLIDSIAHTQYWSYGLEYEFVGRIFELINYLYCIVIT